MENNWNDIIDRTPTEDELVLVWGEVEGYRGPAAWITRWNGNEFVDEDGYRDTSNVSHWMRQPIAITPPARHRAGRRKERVMMP